MELTVQIEPTRACNLNCSICMRPYLDSLGENFLPLEHFQKICDSVVSLQMFHYVGLHGWGEPLLNRQLFDMVRYAESVGLATNLTTNGTLLSERMADIFDSGLRQIAFGVYDQKLLGDVLPSIGELVDTKRRRTSKTPKTYLDVTICQESLHQIRHFIELAHEIGLDAVIVHRLFSVYQVKPSVEYISSDTEAQLFQEIREIAGRSGLEVYLPPGHGYPCRVVKYSIFIDVNGVVTPCCFLPEYYLGNALETDLAEIIATGSHRRFVAEMAEGPICGRCRW